jgi:hypothetical protein
MISPQPSPGDWTQLNVMPLILLECLIIPVGISQINTEFHEIFLLLGRRALKEVPQKAQRDSEYFCELSCGGLKKASLPEEQFHVPFQKLLLALPEKNRLRYLL